MLRPTALMTMFGQDPLAPIAKRIETVAIACMDETAE
jgi:hypothetical protein